MRGLAGVQVAAADQVKVAQGISYTGSESFSADVTVGNLKCFFFFSPSVVVNAINSICSWVITLYMHF